MVCRVDGVERPSHGESNELGAVRIRLWVLGIGPGQLSELTRELTSPPSSAGQLSCSADQLSAALRAIACIFFCRPPPDAPTPTIAESPRAALSARLWVRAAAAAATTSYGRRAAAQLTGQPSRSALQS